MNEEQKGGGPAFPSADKNANGSHYHSHLGMSLRDYFASQTIGVILGLAATCGEEPDFDGAATEAYKAADAMLRARKSSVKPSEDK